MKKIEKPWGYEEILSHTKQYVMKKMYIKPKHRMSLQYHVVKEETIYVVEGDLLLWEHPGQSKPSLVRTGDIYHVVPNQIHRFGAPE